MGECYAEGNAPYAAFAQMILNAADWPADLPQLVLADLISLAPGLRVRYPDVPLNPPLEPMAEQQRLYESAFTFFARLAERQPLLLLLEDMHWADGGTLALARSLTRRFYQTHTPVLLVLTFREGELTEHKGLNDLLTSWNRDRLANPLKLHRLDRQGTQEQLETLFAEEVSADFADSVYRETEGNPFFIEELCKALIEGGQVYRENDRWQRRERCPHRDAAQHPHGDRDPPGEPARSLPGGAAPGSRAGPPLRVRCAAGRGRSRLASRMKRS